MNKVKGPLAKKPMGSKKRNQGGPRSWPTKPGASAFTTTAVVATTHNPNKKFKKPRSK
jgi:hypothetical protein